MINDLITRDGWRAHETVHHVFNKYLDLMYEQLDRPLYYYLLIINLRQDLWQHMKFEETCVLPAYTRFVDCFPTPGKPEHFRADHDLIRLQIDNLSALSLRAEFEPVPPSMLRHDTARLDNLLEHHDEREMDYLYPALRKSLDESERNHILQQMRSFRIMGPDRVLEYQDQLLCSEPITELLSRYCAWLELREKSFDRSSRLLNKVTGEPLLPSLQETGIFPPNLIKLLERTVRITDKFMSTEAGEFRVYANAERLVDQAWRSTIAYAIHEANKRLC